MIQENFIKLYEQSFRENWDLPCYTDYGEDESYSYGQVAQEIAKLHLLFKHCSLRRGDKIAIIGKNNSRWCIAYMATITYGAIVVPILQDFNPNDVHHIVTHSESVFLFTSDAIWDHLEEDCVPCSPFLISAASTSVTVKQSTVSSNIWTMRCMKLIRKVSAGKTYNIQPSLMIR
jgi:long-subunit acyl-CoA synthetase (AMP-forming)